MAMLAGLIPAMTMISRNAWRDALSSGPADLNTLITAVSGPIAAALAAWLFAAVALTTADVLLSQGGSRSSVRLTRAADWQTAAAWFEPSRAARGLTSRWARAIAPAMLRHGIAALLGVTLLSAPAAAAVASTPPSQPLASALPALGLSSACPPVRAEVLATAQPGPPMWDRTGRPPSEGESVRGWVPAPPGQPTETTTAATAGRDLTAVAATGRRRRLDDDAVVVVRKGDTLWSIAERSLGPGASEAQIAGEWPHWFTANRDVIGPDPDRLRPGQRLRPPAHVRIGDR